MYERTNFLSMNFLLAFVFWYYKLFSALQQTPLKDSKMAHGFKMNSNRNNSVVTFLETFASSEMNLLGVQSFEMNLFLKLRETKFHGVDRGINARVIVAALDGDWWC